MFTGIASYARPHLFKLSLFSLVNARLVKGVIAVIDVRDPREKERYMEAIRKARDHGLEVIVDLSSKRRGSTNARNKVFDLAEQILKGEDVLVLYDDDYICPGPHALVLAKVWLKDKTIGLVGGQVINLRRRRVDPDFYLNMIPGFADTLTKLTGFVFLNTKHGPRLVDYTTPLMATRVDVIKKGVRYDPNYKGTGYREESDLQLQLRKLGYKIVHEPRFYAYHFCVDEGGNRSIGETSKRFYWKMRNNVYFIRKNGLGLRTMLVSSTIILTYAMFHGLRVLIASIKGLRDGLSQVIS